MSDHVAVLRRMRLNSWTKRKEIASLDHAIATCEQHAALVAENERLKAELSVRGDYVNETLQAKHAALANSHANLLARLGELLEEWHSRQIASWIPAEREYLADHAADLARVVEEPTKEKESERNTKPAL